jgi:mannose-6-phosphate isomerase-like protein (cupin superfamily)
VVRDTGKRFLRIKAGIEEICLLEFRYSEGEEGPSKHIHKEHCDCFYVQEGRLSFFVGDGWSQAGAGGFVLVPPGVVHTFRNDGPGEARFLNLHVPDKGFADNLRGRRDQWDSFDPPEDGGRPASEAIRQVPAEHELVSVREIELESGEEMRVTGHYYVLEGASPGTAGFLCDDAVLAAGRERMRALVIT